MLQTSPYAVVWVPPSPPVAGCPPGLENLMPLDFLAVQQQIEVLEAITSIETQNKYLVKNRWGHNLFFLEEESSCCARMCLPSCRPLRVKVTDVTQREVMYMDHPGSLMLGNMYVEAPRGNPLGSVHQACSCCTPTFKVKAPGGHSVFKILGPCAYRWCGCCCPNVQFKVLNTDGGAEVGVISKSWSGMVQEGFTDADKFGVSFPHDLDVRLKAVLLGACLLVDLQYFER